MPSKSKTVNSKMARTIPLVKEPMENEPGRRSRRWMSKKIQGGNSRGPDARWWNPASRPKTLLPCGNAPLRPSAEGWRATGPQGGAGGRTHLGSDVLFNQ